MSGFLLGGLLSGLGSGIAKQGEMDAEQRRQLALENLKSQNAQAEAEQQGQITRTNAQYKATLDDWGDSRHVERTTAGTIKVEGVKATNAKDLENLRTANDATLERLKSGLRMTEDQAKAATDLANDLTKAGAEVGEYRVAADGSIWAYSKTGAILGHSAAGKFIPTGAGKKGGEDDTIVGQTMGSGLGGPPSPTPSPSASAPAPARPAPKPAPAPAPVRPAASPPAAPPPRERTRGGFADRRDFGAGADPGMLGKPGALPQMFTDDAMNAFVNNPKNKGRQVLGPDGKVYTVK